MKKILGSAAAAAILAATPAHATNGMRMIGFGPIQNGMGGASVAAPLDATSIVSNPAGISEVAPRFDLAGQGFMPRVKYSADWAVPVPASGSASQTSDRPTDFLPTIASVFKVQDALTVGVAALGTAGMGVEYASGASGLYGQTTMTSYMNGRVAPAMAWKVNDALSIGAAFNLMYAQMEYQAGGGPKHSAASALGFGGTLGVSYKVSEAVTLAAAYETQSAFQDFEFTVAGQKQALSFDQPMVASIGAAFRPLAGLLVALDGQWINWSATNGKDKPKWSKNPLGEPAWNLDWSDQFVVKLGLEYQLAALKELKLRAGYDYGKTPLDASRAFENIAFPAIAENHFTLGLGYDIGKFSVNAAFVYSPESKLTGSNPAQGIASYETRMSQTAFELGGAYRF